MDEYTLQLIFLNEAGDKVTLAAPNAKVNVTEEELITAMDAILINDAFMSSGGKFISKYGAQLVKRNVTIFSMA